MQTTKNDLIQWIKNWFAENGPDAKAIVGLSGGKDSTTVAKLCVEALGKDRVIGVRMPNGVQSDIDVSRKVGEWLGIKTLEVNIYHGNNNLLFAIEEAGLELSDYAKINTPARMRMATLYAIAGTVNGRVANTCNLSEDYVGYATKYGDGAGDFSPLCNFTVREVKALAYELGIPAEFVEKVPSDGLCGKTDEESLGFTYAELDAFLLERKEFSGLERASKMNRANLHKLKYMDYFKPRR